LAPRAELPDPSDFKTLGGQTILSARLAAKGIFPGVSNLDKRVDD
jgi:F0F1-type ATP synthase beta subunit